MFENRRIFRLLLVFIALSAVCACAPKYESMSPKEIYDYADARLVKKNYSDALEAYEKLIDLYPFSIYVTQAELKIADAYFAKKQYALAVEAYEDFMEKHPTNPEFPHALHRLGLSHYEQKYAIDRDQEETHASERALSELTTKYPDYKYFGDAKEKLASVRNDLARRERYVARFYFREKEFYASFKRYERLIRDFQDTPYYQEALYYSGLCLLKLDEPGEAKRYFEQLVSQYPEHKFTKKARSYLNEGR